MFNWVKNLTSATEYTAKSFRNIMKRTAATGFAAAALTLAGGVSVLANDDKLMTVYYVYMDDQYIGTVSDKEVIENMVDTKIKELEGSYKGLQLSLGSKLSFIPEQVFESNSEVNNSEAMNEIKDEIEIQAEAAALVIGGTTVAYVENSEQAEAALTKLKASYVPEKELKALEERKASASTPLPQLKENETRVLDVRFNENISVSQTKVKPDMIISAEEAAKLLQKGTLEEKKYLVKAGDALSSIASAHNLDIKQLIELNSGLKGDSVLKVGQELNVTVLKPYVKVIVEKEVFKKEKISFEKEVIEDSSLPKGDTKVKQEGKNGVRAATYLISEENGQTIKKEVSEEKVLEEPVKHIVIKGTKVIPSRGEGSFAYPAVGGYISSKVGYRWGKMHKGIDIARPSNRTIKAADNGVIVSAGWDGGYGNKIVIDHKNGFRTVYAHLDSISVSAGQTVSKGSKIGVMGMTGDSTGVHLHFELYKNGKMQDPLKYIK
ncbi:murein DD-endopeptidase MepM/ murein hydrolase activator NlpD [Cytobacillus oceanisediminis]|uniref:Murein DD-endopeptidase MepM/ murein hydrolase activator NlpD n=1 Tax=Cytobacillus oceanisediminis TaxID=665099 RepID=A0A2V3A446_9BACI|nr:M23 family metallopeptidase [Cytobacillus oceanisediminis]PWW31047.1 murein DD-endopeptidase MepM/ murein hydrolase activator NlpD [Cytobacillus oceanisediminis]